METTRLSTKGQIVLPKNLRLAHAWKAGTEFTIEATKDGVLLRPAVNFTPTTLEDVAGSLKTRRKPARHLSDRAAIDREIKRRHGLGRY